MSLKEILRDNLNQSNSTQEFFDKIHNIRKKEELVILATGPTLSKYTDKQFSSILENKDVFSIKQAYLKFPKQTDIHFFNCCNLPIDGQFYGYKYANENKPLVIGSSPYHLGGGRWSEEQYLDMFFQIPVVNQHRLNEGGVNYLFKNKNIDDYLFTNRLPRPCGPGIFFEVAMYYAFHLGYKKIYTIGWDLAKNMKDFGHFYSSDGKKATNVRVPSIHTNDELEKSLKFTEHLADWMIKRDIELKVYGDISCVSEKFSRIK